jgi:hypothetical protein
MDFVQGARRTIVAWEHVMRSGERRIKRGCDLPLTEGVVDRLSTDLAVFDIDMTASSSSRPSQAPPSTKAPETRMRRSTSPARVRHGLSGAARRAARPRIASGSAALPGPVDTARRR